MKVCLEYKISGVNDSQASCESYGEPLKDFIQEWYDQNCLSLKDLCSNKLFRFLEWPYRRQGDLASKHGQQ
jgi:hypothetical protein